MTTTGDIIGICGIICATAFMVALSLGVSAFSIGWIWEAWANRHWNAQRSRMQSEMHTLDRWCCYDAPIVSAVVERLAKVADGLPVPHVEGFREDIRSGKYNEATISPITQTKA